MSLPTAPSRTMDQDTFDATTDAFVGALPQFETDMNALAAAMSLNSTTDTSTSSVAIGTGEKTFTVTAGKSFVAGMWLIIADTAAPTTNAMYAQVSSYSGTTLVVNATGVQGSGTKASWQISQTIRADGAVFSGPVLFDTVADIASAATIDLTDYGSGTIATVTGTDATSAFTMDGGQTMTLVAAAAWPLTNTADTCEVLGGDFTAVADDQFTVTNTGGVVRVFPHSLASRAKTTADLRGTSKVIPFTRNMESASGSVDVTGFGGTPVSCDVVAFLNGTSRLSNGSCASDLSQKSVIQSYTGNMTDGGNSVAVLIEAAGKNQTAVVASFSADTVTLNWTRNGVTGPGTAYGYITARF